MENPAKPWKSTKRKPRRRHAERTSRRVVHEGQLSIIII